jgi:hypothetical protein
MGHVLVELVPLALAAALSTVPITAAILILLSEKSGESALPFMAGWVVGTASALTLWILAAAILPDRPRQAKGVISTLEVVVGAALVVFGVVSFVRHRRTPSGRRPGWMDALGSFSSLPAFGIGLALNVRPKAVLLYAAASLSIRKASLGVDETIVLIVLYTAIATSTVVAPVLVSVFAPEWMEPRLVAARDWITLHGPAATAVVMAGVGAFVMYAGLT